MISEVPKMADKKVNGFEKYEIENAARTLIEAKEMENKPKLFTLAKKEVERQAKAAQAVLKQLPKKP